ncbi:GGDEF domain-containing protein [Flavimaricola marinus]|uniref:diguanylate cyclase n=1 Tax=Flavimaricola marinus TaxID=1819565 RepID=A0A238LJC3_9RHOB|nr:GGDEF domain-containing protein [Flavimaricola marinus]SMY09643.1 Phytochrome-like protein cph2 [Flavimaricola marinus]
MSLISAKARTGRNRYVLLVQYWRKPLAVTGMIFATWGMMLRVADVIRGDEVRSNSPQMHPLIYLALIWMSIGLFRFRRSMPIARLRIAVSTMFLCIALFHLLRGVLLPSSGVTAFSRFGSFEADTALILVMLYGCNLTWAYHSRSSQLFLIAGVTLVLNAVVGQTYSLSFFGGQMSPLTALALLANTLAIVTINANRPQVRVVFLADEIGLRTRLMLVAGVIVPWFAGGLLVRTIPMSEQHAQMASVGIAIVIWCIAAMTIYSGYLNNKSDGVRRVAERRLRVLATQDALTGVLNRAGLMIEMNRNWERFQAGKGTSGVILLDLDNFKKINDTYGHDEGDRILSAIGDAIRPVLRRRDRVGRWGGEEFVILLSDIEMVDLFTVAERIRKRVQGLAEALTDQDAGADTSEQPTYQTSASFGISRFQPGDKSVYDALKRADVALYQAKSAGRNRVVLHQDLAA